MIKRISQIFFDFGNGKRLKDYPFFVQSHRALKSFPGWRYKLWNEEAVERLIRTHRPELWDMYASLEHPIMCVDFAKLLIADVRGGIVADLDVLPLCHPDHIVGDRDYVFDRCSRPHVVANDFLYVGEGGLPGIWPYFVENLARVRGIAAYQQRKMRFVFQSTGPDFLTRYIRRAGLSDYVRAISSRTFLDPKEHRRSVSTRDPQIEVVHHLSWRSHVLGANARPGAGARGTHPHAVWGKEAAIAACVCVH
jgi:mannosyltransferase OCH1-like enzyme